MGGMTIPIKTKADLIEKYGKSIAQKAAENGAAAKALEAPQTGIPLLDDLGSAAEEILPDSPISNPNLPDQPSKNLSKSLGNPGNQVLEDAFNQGALQFKKIWDFSTNMNALNQALENSGLPQLTPEETNTLQDFADKIFNDVKDGKPKEEAVKDAFEEFSDFFNNPPDSFDDLGDFLDNIAELFGDAETTISPLVLDLDGDGIELIAVEESNAYFDMDEDTFAERVGWTSETDGLLAIDRNNNGTIDHIGELFGNAEVDGFAELAELDSNNDGVIDSDDPTFGDLLIWIDGNGDGVSQSEELSSAEERSIISLNLSFGLVNYELAGNPVTHEGTYSLSDGATMEMIDVWFTTNQTNTEFVGSYPTDLRSMFMPNLRGYGNVPDLHIAINLDEELRNATHELAGVKS